MTPPPLLRLQELSAGYGGRRVIRDITFDLAPGEIVTLLGPNGAGKSTLVRVILGLQSAMSGTLLRQPGLVTGYVPQRFHVDPTLPITVDSFMALNRPRAQAEYALRQLQAEELRDRPLAGLSGGELQRVLLARAISHRPQLLVLDEPAQGVDINGQAELYQLIRRLRDQLHCGVLLVSHDLHLVMSATDKVLCLNGHVCCAGHPESVSTDPAFIKMFGRQVSNTLAVYHHHHDHHHHADGSIAAGAECHRHA